jgi:hypothetical protein
VGRYSAPTALAINGRFPNWYIRSCRKLKDSAVHHLISCIQEYIKPVRVCIKCKKLCWKAEAIIAAINANDLAAMQVVLICE